MGFNSGFKGLISLHWSAFLDFLAQSNIVLFCYYIYHFYYFTIFKLHISGFVYLFLQEYICVLQLVKLEILNLKYIYNIQPILYIVIRPDDFVRFLFETYRLTPTEYNVLFTDCQTLIWLQRPDYCPLKGHNPGLLLACSLDITP